MPEGHPFVDRGDGFPTSASARSALGVVGLGRLENLPVRYGQQTGSMSELITHCRIDRLTQNWPTGFIQTVIGAASEAGQ